MTDQTPALPRFNPDAELCVDTPTGAVMWSGQKWNNHMAAAERNQSQVVVRLVSIEDPGREFADRIPAPRPVPTTRHRLDDARSHALEVERDDLRIQTGRLEADNRAMMRDRDQALAERDETRRTVTAQTAQLRANRTLLDRLRELGELTDRAWAEHDTNADREYAALSFTAAVCPTCHLLKIDHTDGPCQPALGSPPPRAQDAAQRPTAGQLARLFHETYEGLAPVYGYRTREESAKPWEQVPQQNRELMIATCARVLLALFEPATGGVVGEPPARAFVGEPPCSSPGCPCGGTA